MSFDGWHDDPAMLKRYFLFFVSFPKMDRMFVYRDFSTETGHLI
jgi:hypothetical protein